MDKLTFAILDILQEYRAVSQISAMSQKSIQHYLAVKLGINVKPSTLYARLCMLTTAGFAKIGMKESRQHTYYITQKGIQTFKEVTNND